MVHERPTTESGKALEMRVSGKVLNGNLIMFDKETDSEWLQETGKSLTGEHKGKQLTELSEDQQAKNVRWDVWRKQHPDSKVLYCGHCEDEQKKP